MKQYLFVIIALLMLVASVHGQQVDFQSPSDMTLVGKIPACSGGSYSYVHNTTGGNSYVVATCNIISVTPSQMTYSAATISGGGLSVALYDAAFTNMYERRYLNDGRSELKMVGGQAYVYSNGVLIGNSGVLPQNPTYVGWGSWSISATNVDDEIWGSTESRYIFGMPEPGYFLMKDLINPGASGFYRVNQTDPNGTPSLIYSTFFPSQFGKNSGTNETVTFSSPTGGTQLTYATGAAYSGTINWNLTQFFNNNAPYGFYQTTINPQLDSPGYSVSDWIPYIGNGATIVWDKQSYTVGQTATLTTTISDSYYDASTYSYHIKIQDANFNTISDQPVTIASSGFHTGSVTYTFTSLNPNGIYYGEIWATKKSDSSEIMMMYSTSYMTTILTVDGYVHDAQNATVLSGAMVNVTQGSTTDTNITGTDGFYTSRSSFTANAPTTIVASKSGYETYQTVFIPLSGGELKINLTLVPTFPRFNGTALGGVARVTPYNRTVNNVTILIQNSSAPGGNITATTNAVGYYIVNYMPPNYLWDIWGSKSGFLNSTVVQKLVVGV